MGRDGFYPFDLLAAAYAMNPRSFNCAIADAWVTRDRKWWEWFARSEALMVGLTREMPSDAGAVGPMLYCPEISQRLHSILMSSLVAAQRR